jgi:hypothetical protein
MTDRTMTDEGSTDSPTPEGQTPRRVDNRSLLHMLHDEIGERLGIGQSKGAGKHVIDGQAKTVDQAVDDAVSGAQGAHPDY